MAADPKLMNDALVRAAFRVELERRRNMALPRIPNARQSGAYDAVKNPIVDYQQIDATRGANQNTKATFDLKVLKRSDASKARAMDFMGSFEHYLRELGRWDVNFDLYILNDSELSRLKEVINAIDKVHDLIMTRI